MKTIDKMFELSVFVHGREVREYFSRGETFVEARIGNEYELRVVNHSGRRVLVVPSVDGLSIMTGQRASRDGNGYVVGTYGHLTIKGWRVDNQDVAHFAFGRLPEGYAAQTERPENVGVIGAAFFYEKFRFPDISFPLPSQPVRPPRPPWWPIEPLFFGHDSNGEAYKDGPRKALRGASDDAATVFGRRTPDPVRTVEFDRENSPAGEVAIRYAVAERLRERGIILDSPHAEPVLVVGRPQAFPADQGCPPPRGWRGRE